MKKNIILLLISLLCLVSCDFGKTRPVYKTYVDDEYNLRVLQYREDATTISVDEYYYTSDIYSGNIEINITIPDEIGGMKVTEMYRPVLTYVKNPTTGSTIGSHDEAHRDGGVGFEIICYSFFEEGTTFDITINIGANINSISLETWRVFEGENTYSALLFGRNGEKKEDTNVEQLFPCNLYFNVSRKNRKFHSINGILYLRNDPVPCFDYEPIKYVKVEQNQYPSDYNMDVND